MGSVLHVVPGLDNPCSGIAVVAKKLADMQGAEVAEARGVRTSAISSAIALVLSRPRQCLQISFCSSLTIHMPIIFF